MSKPIIKRVNGYEVIWNGEGWAVYNSDGPLTELVETEEEASKAARAMPPKG